MKCRHLPRVIFVSHSPWPAGAERALFNFLENLPPNHIQPFVVFPITNGPMKIATAEKLNIPVFELEYGFSIPTVEQSGAQQKTTNEVAEFIYLFRELEVDAVVINTTVLLSAVIAAGRMGLPLLLHSHGVVSPRLFPRLETSAWHRYELLQLQLADMILVPSPWVARYYEQTYRMQSKQLTILPNGTPIPSFTDGKSAISKNAPPEFVMLCTLEPNKGVHTFLKSAAILLKNRPNAAIFRIYGDGAPEYRHSLEIFIAENKLSAHCFLHPKIADVGTIYRNCFSVVVASEIESFSFVTIEAMSYGKPVIATRCGGPDGILENGVTGQLVAVGDADALAAAMLQLLDSPTLTQEMAANARREIEAKYNIRDVAKKYLDAILLTCKTPLSAFDRNRKLDLIELTQSNLCIRSEAPFDIRIPASTLSPEFLSEQLSATLASERLLLESLQYVYYSLREANMNAGVSS